MRSKANSMAETISDAIWVTAESIGYPELCCLQETAVRALVTGKDVFVSIPIGGGKSLCYSVLPSMFDILRGKPQSLASMQSWEAMLCVGDAILCDEMQWSATNYWLMTITWHHANENPISPRKHVVSDQRFSSSRQHLDPARLGRVHVWTRDVQVLLTQNGYRDIEVWITMSVTIILFVVCQRAI